MKRSAKGQKREKATYFMLNSLLWKSTVSAKEGEDSQHFLKLKNHIVENIFIEKLKINQNMHI
jgi:hypothetical protein